ncbi:MAG: helix-hairpin-helix domain-containing protein [bacterium]
MILLLLIAAQIDLNRAKLDEFYKLPVDSTIAYRIYEYRKTYGRFESIYELRQVKGIDAEIFEIIKPLIKVAVPFPARTEWGSILNEQKKLASEEPPAKAAIDEWEDLIRSPMYINDVRFDELLMIDRMTPIDAAAVMRLLEVRKIGSARDLRRAKGLTHYAYTSLRKYVQFIDEPPAKKPTGSIRLRFENINRLDTGEDDNIATRISYLESALDEYTTTSMDLQNVYSWSSRECDILENNLEYKLDTLKMIVPKPMVDIRAKINYQKRLRFGIRYNEYDMEYKGYVGVARLGPIDRFYLGHYRVVWGEGLMIDNSDEYRARIYSRSTGIFGDLTDNFDYDLFGAAGSFTLSLFGLNIKPSFFYSEIKRDGLINPDGTLWRLCHNPTAYSLMKDKVSEQTYAAHIRVSPVEKYNPGTQLGFEAMQLSYDKIVNPYTKWVDIPFDKYDPTFYPEITSLSTDSMRLFYGATFQLPIANTFISGEIVRQDAEPDPSYAYLIKGRIQYDFLYLNMLFRHYNIGYDNPFHRGFSEYRRFEDTPFEKPYALVDPEYITIYDDPTPKPEQGLYIETRYQITRSFLLTRAYLDIFKNLAHNYVNQRGFLEFEIRPAWPVRIRFSQKVIKKYLPKPISATLSRTSESTAKVFFFLSNYDALRFEARWGNVALMSTDEGDLDLNGGFVALSYDRNFSNTFSIEGGIAMWSTDGMSQWIFEDIGIDFLSGYGMKYYIVSSQKIGNLLFKLKFGQKFTHLPHTGLYNNPDIYYPDLPGVRVYDFTNNENRTKINLQLDYLF